MVSPTDTCGSACAGVPCARNPSAAAAVVTHRRARMAAHAIRLGTKFVVAFWAMSGRTVQLRVGGQTYRVVTSASDEELRRLAAVVDQKLETVVSPGRAVTPQAMLLAAMALAHDLEEERSRSAAFADKARGAFGRMLAR